MVYWAVTAWAKPPLSGFLLGLESPTRGQTHLLGCESSCLTADIHGRIGYVAEGHNLIQHYKVDKLINLCRGLSLKWDQNFLNRLLETFRLPLDRKIKNLSSGMRAQLNLSLAMAIDPELLILDDPTLGLDTVARRQFLELAIDLIQQDGRTILFSSHILSDVERIADRIGIAVPDAGFLVHTFITIFLGGMACYSFGLLIGGRSGELASIVGIILVTALLMSLIVIKGFGLQIMIFFILFTLAAIIGTWQKFMSVSL